MTISVVIPAYNEEKYLSQCLASLKKQSFKPKEIIVVDNNSQDKTEQIGKKFKVKLVKEKKQGMAYARDRGFYQAKGEIIARTDADTVLPSDWLLKIVNHFKQDPSLVGVTGTTRFYDLFSEKTKGGSFLNSLSSFWFTFWLYFFKICAGHHQCNGPNFAIRKSVLAKISPCSNNPYCHEDMDLACHITAVGKVIFDPTLIAYSSSRRIKTKPFEIVLKYTFMWIYTFLTHGHPFLRSHKKGGLKKLQEKEREDKSRLKPPLPNGPIFSWFSQKDKK